MRCTVQVLNTFTVFSQIDFTHTARAELLNNAVMGNCLRDHLELPQQTIVSSSGHTFVKQWVADVEILAMSLFPELGPQNVLRDN
jgi:hypothetical protein